MTNWNRFMQASALHWFVLFFSDFCILWCTIDATQAPKALLFIKLQKYKDVSRPHYLRATLNASRHADFLRKKKSSHLSILYIITWFAGIQGSSSALHSFVMVCCKVAVLKTPHRNTDFYKVIKNTVALVLFSAGVSWIKFCSDDTRTKTGTRWKQHQPNGCCLQR